MRALALAVCLLWLSSSALAQDEPTMAVPDGYAEETTPGETESVTQTQTDSEAEPARVASAPLGVRIAAEGGAAFGAGFLIGVPAPFIARALEDDGSGLPASDEQPLFSGAMIGCAIAPLVTTLAVFVLGSKVFNGDGGVGWTLLGAYAGAVVGFFTGVGIGSALGDISEESAALVVGVSVLFSAIGAVMGYEASNDAIEPGDVREERTSFMVIPTLAPIEGGATAGVVGVF